MIKYLKLLPKTYKEWMKNNPFEQSAVIAYYTLFSLPSLLVIVVTIAGYFYGREAVQNQITSEIKVFIGESSAEAINGMISNAFLDGGSIITILFGIGMLLFGATGAFFQLKRAMNRVWGVRAKKENFQRILIDRAISLGMILVIGFMLLVSLVVSAVIQGLGDYVRNFAPEVTSLVLSIFNFLISYIFIGLLFAGVFKLLPDIKINWKVTFIGASVTTILFLVGEYLLGFYFGQSDPASVYGGASSVILILLWVFYSCLIMLFGAEFTVQYALFRGVNIQPNSLAESAEIHELEELREREKEIKKKQQQLEELQTDGPGKHAEENQKN
ncbi:YihY/virulence factor BrkB family protein [Mesonia aestuariivivens]|uniref:YihY/virulence factor BrkB family protein n=1 Tax=Mesonia aestuariivivens TaxID=2796128 RepID=A0ABS6VYM4_9FLAO|nr:YihY/virulence factor BrkB family protein [Mesonia aestuariivivens]MBW2960684.1 YihY/virulence factor BrkB family protein [Mesonia aestuariivivens]